MKKFLLLCLLLAAAFLGRLHAAEPDFTHAFSLYKANGAAPFARAIYDTDSEAAKSLVARLSALTKDSGDFVSYEIVSRKPLTKKVERLVLAVYFDRFPLYLRLDYYESPRGIVVLPALLSKEASEVLPFDIIAATGK